MNIMGKEKKWIFVFTILAISLLINTVFAVQIYQRQEKMHATSLQELDELNRQWSDEYSTLSNDFLETVSELQMQLTEQEKTLADTTARLEWLAEENELLKKKLQ